MLRTTVLASLAVAGCDLSQPPLDVDRRVEAARVAITRSCLQVAVNSGCEAEAMAFDRNGRQIVKAFLWTVEDPALATLTLKPGFDTTVVDILGRAVGSTTLKVEVRDQPDVIDTDPLNVVGDNVPN